MGGGPCGRRFAVLFGDPIMSATRLTIAVAFVVASTASALAASPEPPAGASSCSGCHAARANVDTAVPRLAGRPAADIVAQMQAFKTGQKPSTVMGRIAKGFTDAEVEAIAAWYAQQK
jgi:cytochrome subunit of sulfide dehydrogenase